MLRFVGAPLRDRRNVLSKSSRCHIQGSTGYGLRKNCWAAPPKFWSFYESNITDHTLDDENFQAQSAIWRPNLRTYNNFSKTTDLSKYSVHMGPPAPTYFIKKGVKCRAFCWILHFRGPIRARCNLREIFLQQPTQGTLEHNPRKREG